jgi:CHAT domain-containing protein
VVLIPDGEVFRVAFAGLWNRRTRRYLIEERELQLAPSLSILKASPLEHWQLPERVVLIDAGGAQEEGTELPDASREIAELSALYPNPTRIGGALCTRANVLQAIRTCGLAHFAGHGLQGSALADPALVLHPGGRDGGLLYPAEIGALKLVRTKLVVLGACGTADGRIGSEGPMSIARSFLSAGAERVVGTLWPVEDKPTRELLTAFHRTLRAGSEPAAALRAVQLNSIRNSVSVQNWAAFEVIQRGI